MSRVADIQKKIAILKNDTTKARATSDFLQQKIQSVPLADADKIICIGGDGFMLETLHDTIKKPLAKKPPIYGINRGSYGFLLNGFDENKDDIVTKINHAKPLTLHPLHLTAIDKNGTIHQCHAINEVSLFRRIAQIAKLRIKIDGQVRLESLWCDGIIISTPAGSTAYNYAAYGSIVPLDSKILCLTPIAPFRPPRWRGALLPHDSHIVIEVIESEKRPVSAVADNVEIEDVVKIELFLDKHMPFTLLFDPDAGLAERILTQQFSI